MERGLLLAICLGVINIALNTAVYKTAASASTFAQAVASPMFWLAFITGTLALFCMLGMYFTKYSLSQGILIAGATSIILGTIWGVLVGRTSLSTFEWLLWGTIAAFYIARFISIAK